MNDFMIKKILKSVVLVAALLFAASCVSADPHLSFDRKRGRDSGVSGSPETNTVSTNPGSSNQMSSALYQGWVSLQTTVIAGEGGYAESGKYKMSDPSLESGIEEARALIE